MNIRYIITSIIVVVTIAIVIGCCYFAYRKGKMSLREELKTDLFYVQAVNLANSWLFSEAAWETVYIVLSVLPFILTLSVLFFECKYQDVKMTVILLSIISLSSMSLSYFLKPHARAQMFRRAYKRIHPVIIEYVSWEEPNEEIKQKICKAIEMGEENIAAIMN